MLISLSTNLRPRKGSLQMHGLRWYKRLYGDQVPFDWISFALLVVIMDFKRFYTPHTGDAVYSFIKDVIDKWHLGRNIQCITTTSATYTTSGVRMRHQGLSSAHPGVYGDIGGFYFSVVAQIINCAIKECITLVTKNENLRSSSNCIHSSLIRKV